eukprot:TRINITY_DN781_c0_g1_i3.p1 TRINITY_DN781_c0_g1~~TRINITY_DN781_c0_g1_i3.p1  ORF type:complete len:335 (+),score=29.94 TRINITY_DN781_c0_g1_i3:52-1056(+)
MSFTNCTLYPDECESSRVTFTLLIAVIGTLSFMGSLSIIATLIWFKLYKELKHRMILYLSFADITQSIAAMTSYGWLERPPNATETMCFLQGFLFNVGDVTSSLWNANVCLFVTFFIISTATVETRNMPGKKYEIFSVVVWLFGIFLSLFGLTLQTEEKPYFYGPISGGVECWITDDFPAERMSLHYVWMFVSLGVMVILTTINLVYLCSRSFGALDKKINGLIITLVGYPIIYAIVFMPLTTLRVLTTLNIPVPVEVILTGVLILVGNGILNALYYGISRNLYQKWKSEIAGKTVRGKNSTSKSTDKSKSKSRGRATQIEQMSKDESSSDPEV